MDGKRAKAVTDNFGLIVTIEKKRVLPAVQYDGTYGTVPELLFEKKLIPALQQMLIAHSIQMP